MLENIETQHIKQKASKIQDSRLNKLQQRTRGKIVTESPFFTIRNLTIKYKSLTETHCYKLQPTEILKFRYYISYHRYMQKKRELQKSIPSQTSQNRNREGFTKQLHDSHFLQHEFLQQLKKHSLAASQARCNLISQFE